MLKRMAFERPTDYYDERIFEIDEQICSLLKQRKEISNNNPGFPLLEDIAYWAEKFDLYEDLLRSLFGVLRNDEEFRPRIEPKGFLKHIPVLKSVEKGNFLYTVTFIRQYTNASVVILNIDWDPSNDNPGNRPEHSFYEMFLGEQYDCRVF